MFMVLGSLIMCAGLWLFADASSTPGDHFAQSVLAGFLIFMPYWIAVARREE